MHELVQPDQVYTLVLLDLYILHNNMHDIEICSSMHCVTNVRRWIECLM